MACQSNAFSSALFIWLKNNSFLFENAYHAMQYISSSPDEGVRPSKIFD